MSADDPYFVPDGGTLRRLANGLEIVRREKHEWKASLDALPADKLAQRTDKIWGSKFLSDWTLPTLILWIERVIQEEHWTLQPGQPRQASRVLDRKIGLVAGAPTRKMRVVCDGRYVHAYPVAE